MKLRVFNQRTDLVHVTTHNVKHNLLVGMMLVSAVLFIFLGDLVSAGIVTLVIPLSLLFSVTVLYVQGKSANLLSVGAVDFGIIVDSSVIIVENIYRHITAHGADRRQPLIDRIAEASHEIERRALFFSNDDHHALRPSCPLCDVGPRRGTVRADGEHLRLRDLRRTRNCGDAGPRPLFVLVPQQEGGTGHDHRSDHEKILHPCAELGAQPPLFHGWSVLGAMLIFTATLVPGLGANSCRSWRREPLDPGSAPPNDLTRRGRAGGAAATRGHCVDSRDPGRDVACGPPR